MEAESSSQNWTGPSRLSTASQMELLRLLVDRLAAKGVEALIYLLGGAAAGIAYYPDGVDRRSSADIDARFTARSQVLAEAEAMAAELGLRPDWFNKGAEQFLPPTGEPDGEVLMERGGVRVVVAPPRFLLAMKLRASRLGRDDEDIAVLIRVCGIKSVAEAEALVEEVYLGEEEIHPRGRSFIAAVFGEYQLSKADPPITLPKVIDPECN